MRKCPNIWTCFVKKSMLYFRMKNVTFSFTFSWISYFFLRNVEECIPGKYFNFHCTVPVFPRGWWMRWLLIFPIVHWNMTSTCGHIYNNKFPLASYIIRFYFMENISHILLLKFNQFENGSTNRIINFFFLNKFSF